MLLLNSAEGGSDTTTVTTSNSAGDSGQAWNAVTIGSGAAITYSATTAANGNLSYHVTTGGTGAQAYLQWNGLITQPSTTMYARMYVYFPSTPAANLRFFEFTNSSVAAIAQLSVSSSGTKFSMFDSTATPILNSTTTIPTAQWVRLEFKCVSSATVGQTELKIFTTPSSNTPTEILTSTATQNTRGGNIQTAIFGDFSTSANFNIYYDDMGVQDTGYIGVSPYLNNFRQNSAEGQTSGTTLAVANSGGSSGDPLDLVTFGGTGTAAFSNVTAMHGTMSYAMTCPSSTDSVYLAFSNRVQDTAGAYRYYVRFSAFPSANMDLSSLVSTSNGTPGKVQITAAGGFKIMDNTGSQLKAFSTISTNTWYRVEVQCVIGTTTSNGTISMQYFLGDSLTAIDTYSAINVNAGVDLISNFRFGKISAAAGTIGATYFDDIAFINGNNYPIGPASASPTPNVAWIQEQLAAPSILTGTGYSTSSNSTGSTTIVLNKPSSLANGDYMLVCIGDQATGSTWSLPSGWNTVTTSNASGVQGIFYKYIPSASAESATSYTFTASSSGRYVADLVIVRGANPSTFVDTTGTWVTSGANSVVDTSVTTSIANTLLVAFNVVYRSDTTVIAITQPAGFTQATQQNSPVTANSTTSQIAYKALPIPVTTGTQTFTFSATAAATDGIMFAIKPANFS